MGNNLFALLEINRPSVSSSAADTVGKINDILKGFGIAVGVIIITVAIVKLILGLAQDRPEQTAQSSMMFGVGFIFVSVSKVLSILALDSIDTTTANGMAVKILNIIAGLLNIAGVIIAAIAIIHLIMAIANEQPESKITGTKLLGTAIGLISAQALANRIAIRLNTNTTAGMSYVYDVVGYIANVVSYIGAGLAAMSIWYLIDSFKSEEAREREMSRRFFIAAVGLIGIRFAITKVLGFTPTLTF